METNSKIKLKAILDVKSYMKIAIDNGVDLDENGNYLINVGYLRVSTDKQAEEGFGLDVQEKDVMKYARLNELTNLVLFTDDGWTGTNMDRPALNAIITLIEQYNSGRTKIRINSFIVPRIDRLGRTLYGTLQFIQDYIVAQRDSKNSLINRNKEDISFISVAERDCRIDKEDPRSKFLFMLFATLAEYDRDMIVQKLQRGRIARVEDGKWMGGGNLPYGYRYDKELGILVIVPEEAEKVKEVFRLYIDEKLSPGKIATMLGFKGERIVTQILRRKSLTGCIEYKGKEYRGDHEPIISLERWNEAQYELERRSVYRGDAHYLLSGLLYCGECGAKMRYQRWDKKTGACKLVCYSHQKSKKYLVKDENCDNGLFWAEDIEDAVINELFGMSFLGDENSVKEKPYFDLAASLAKDLQKEKQRLERLYDFDDDDDDEVIKNRIARSRAKIKEIQSAILDEEKNAEINRRIDKAKELLRTLEATWPHMSREERQAVCRELIDRVEVCKDRTVKVNLKLKSYLIANNV